MCTYLVRRARRREPCQLGYGSVLERQVVFPHTSPRGHRAGGEEGKQRYAARLDQLEYGRARHGGVDRLDEQRRVWHTANVEAIGVGQGEPVIAVKNRASL